jgi:hypothetical protein
MNKAQGRNQWLRCAAEPVQGRLLIGPQVSNLPHMAAAVSIVFLLAFGASAKDPKTEPEVRYDVATVTDVKATVVSIREVSKTEPLDGLYLTVKSDKNETIDVYVGPSEFVKTFGVTFAKGDEIEVIGSKLKVDGAALILAREVTRKETTLILRDKNGEPFWVHWTRPTRG